MEALQAELLPADRAAQRASHAQAAPGPGRNAARPRRADSPSRANSRCAMRPRLKASHCSPCWRCWPWSACTPPPRCRIHCSARCWPTRAWQQQRAFVQADLGIEQALRDLAATAPPVDYTRTAATARNPATASPWCCVPPATMHCPPASAPVASSPGAFEIRSTGHSARGARSVQVQGAVRVQATAAAP